MNLKKCYFRKNGHGVYENHLKLIKKANKDTTTTLNKKVDVSSPKVTDKITVPRINTTSYDTLVHINIETNTKSIKIPKLETNTPEIKKIKIQSLTLTI
jgi:putative lipase involved disintegration of autophagic bodies